MLRQAILDKKVEKYFNQITAILETQFSDHHTKVYLYGSRSRNEAHYGSDIDLAIQTIDLPKLKLAEVKEAFFESTIPYKVDVIDLETVDESFKKNIINDGVLIWKN